MKVSLLALAAVASAAVFADTAGKQWSAVTLVDTRDSAARFAKSDSAITYAARYAGGTAADHVTILKVTDPDTEFAVTSVVRQCAAGEEGSVLVDLAATDSRRFRLVHVVSDADGAEVDDSLAADMAFGYTGAAAQTLVDTRTNSLQLVAEDGGPAVLSYSTDWITNGTPAHVEISSVKECFRKGALISSETNVLMTAASPAVGDFPHAIDASGGTVTLRCGFYDSDGRLLDELLTASYRFKEKWGMVLIFR